MLQRVVLKDAIDKKDFLRFLDSTRKQELIVLAAKLKGKKVLHINATSQGGGVAELLQSVIPYMRALDIDASWYSIDAKKAGESFFEFTNRLHNALQGSIRKFSKEDWNNYVKVNKAIAKDLDTLDYDILVIHDPQPLAAAEFVKNKKPQVCVIHIDTTTPDPIAWKNILRLTGYYEHFVFSNKDFVNQNLPEEKLHIILPAIDPLAAKQTIVPAKKAREYLQEYGIPQDGQLVVQVSRFDVWKNPHGVIEAFWLLEKKYPKAQLVMVGFQEARDNPQAEKVYMDIRAMSGKDPRIFLFFDPKRIGGAKNIQQFTTMAQNAADIVVQNSTKEGFGLTVAEAMWKGKPVIGGPGSGIRKQIQHDKNGLLAETTKDLVHYLEDLLSNPHKRKALGKAGKEGVRKNFLMPRFVLDHVRVYNSIYEAK